MPQIYMSCRHTKSSIACCHTSHWLTGSTHTKLTAHSPMTAETQRLMAGERRADTHGSQFLKVVGG